MYYICKLINEHDSEYVSQIQVPSHLLSSLIEIALVSDYELLICDYHDGDKSVFE